MSNLGFRLKNCNRQEVGNGEEIRIRDILVRATYAEHGGDPALFLEESKRLSGIKSLVMAPGEVMILKRQLSS